MIFYEIMEKIDFVYEEYWDCYEIYWEFIIVEFIKTYFG